MCPEYKLGFPSVCLSHPWVVRGAGMHTDTLRAGNENQNICLVMAGFLELGSNSHPIPQPNRASEGNDGGLLTHGKKRL